MIKPEDIRLELTCGACPEQYDAFVGDEMVGYLRLRWGAFRVDYPDCGGETIFEASPEGHGMFEDHERGMYLDLAKKAIAARHNGAEERPQDEEGWKAAVVAGETFLSYPDWLKLVRWQGTKE